MARKPPVKPTESTDDRNVSLKERRLDHDAFGRIILTKRQGGNVSIFGSELQHNSTVAIVIERASYRRSLHENRVAGGETLIEFQMSESQWAQFVSSQGIGAGTPVTLRYASARGTGVVEMPEIDMTSERDDFQQEIRDSCKAYMEEAQKAVNLLEGMLDAKSVSKADVRVALNHMRSLAQSMPANMGFLQEQFHESMEQITEAAKTEAEAFVSNVIHNAGLEHLRATAPTMLAGGLGELKTIEIEGGS